MTARKEEGQRLLSSHPLDDGEDSEDDVLMFEKPNLRSQQEQPLAEMSQEQGPPPLYSNPPQEQAGQAPALLVPTPLTTAAAEHVTQPQAPTMMPQAMPVPANEAPPDYYFQEPKSQLPGVTKATGLAVNIQMNGQLIPGTVMEDASGRHMVYICQPQQTTESQIRGGSTEKPPPPKDYLLLSIISLLCCCAPLGIVALIKSLEVHRLYREGNYVGAARASRQAHSWASAAVVFGTTIIIIFFALKVYYAEYETKYYTNYY